MSETSLHPVTWFDFFGSFPDIFKFVRNHNMITDTECAIATKEDPNLNKTTFRLTTNIEVLRDNPYGFSRGSTISKFQLLCAVKFKHDQRQAIFHIQYELRGFKTPLIRVGCDYFKVITKDTQYGGALTYPKPWKKETIIDDETKSIIPIIPKYDDFIIVPDNKNYQPVIKNCYNLYSPFTHEVFEGSVKESDIPVTVNFLKHIFQEHYNLSLIYLKVLYENPKQKLPILCLVSETNETGKTTFINFLEMIFGGNYVLVTPDHLTRQFNLSFATKNIIAAEEAFVEKAAGVEKLKALSTDKSIQMSRKFIDDQTLPFFGKIILCTNNVKDFMRIKSKEIRFWIREVPVIQGKKNNLIEKQLFAEIPKFLKFLEQQPAVDYDNGSRMIFTYEQIQTKALHDVKEESKVWLQKSIEIHLDEFFDINDGMEFMYATVTDIKTRWFINNSKAGVDYISKVLREDMGLRAEAKPMKYDAFTDKAGPTNGRPYKFYRKDEVRVTEPQTTIYSEIDPPF